MNLIKLTKNYIKEELLENLLRSEKVDLLFEELAILEDWDLILQILDHLDKNNDRNFNANRNFSSSDEILYDGNREDSFIPIRDVLKLSSEYNWLDIIYSDCPDNMYQLTDDEYLMYGLKKLTGKQKEVFFLRVIKGYTNSEIAIMLGKSDRNIRKLYDKAIETLKIVLEETYDNFR